MSTTEKLKIKIGLSGTYWDRRPIYNILFNDQLLFTKEITAESNIVEYVEFDAEAAEGAVVLKIQLVNKLSTDTVESEDKSKILKDLLLNIESIEIDDINLGQLPFNLCEYYPDQPVQFDNQTTTVVKNCMNLGWNGTWTLKWNNPFYIWLLENI